MSKINADPQDIIDRNKQLFSTIEELIEKETQLDTILVLCSLGARFAFSHHAGFFFSKTIENKLTDCSELLVSGRELSSKYCKNSFLHVMTKCSGAGGHTRIVERWISQAQKDQKHSVVLLSQENEKIPELLENAVEHKLGQLYDFNRISDRLNYNEKSIKLREIASDYEYVILHTDMCDIVPVLAFGTRKFKRPILFYNHADQYFWLGKSIADVVLDMSSKGRAFSRQKRRIENSRILPVLLDCKEQKIDKNLARRKLGLPLNKKIFLSVGSSGKYRTKSKENFQSLALTLVKEYPESKFIVIGPRLREKDWKEVYAKSHGKVHAIGSIPRTELNDYVSAADLFIESYPEGAGTTVLDVFLLKVPAISIQTRYCQFDSFCQYTIEYKNVIKAAKKILQKKGNDVEALFKNVKKDHCKESWIRRLDKILCDTHKEHRINKIESTRVDLSEYDFSLAQRTEDTHNNKVVATNEFLMLTFKVRKLLFDRMKELGFLGDIRIYLRYYMALHLKNTLLVSRYVIRYIKRLRASLKRCLKKTR